MGLKAEQRYSWKEKERWKISQMEISRPNHAKKQKGWKI